MGLIIHSHVLFRGVFSSPFSVYQAYRHYKGFLCGFCTDLALNNKEYGCPPMMSTSSKFMKIGLMFFFCLNIFLTYLFSLLIRKWGQIWKFIQHLAYCLIHMVDHDLNASFELNFFVPHNRNLSNNLMQNIFVKSQKAFTTLSSSIKELKMSISDFNYCVWCIISLQRTSPRCDFHTRQNTYIWL